MDDSVRQEVLQWLQNTPDDEELIQEAVLGLLEHGPVEEEVLLKVSKEISEAVMALHLILLASLGQVTVGVREDGQLFWSDPDSIVSQEAEEDEEFSQDLATL